MRDCLLFAACSLAWALPGFAAPLNCSLDVANNTINCTVYEGVTYTLPQLFNAGANFEGIVLLCENAPRTATTCDTDFDISDAFRFRIVRGVAMIDSCSDIPGAGLAPPDFGDPCDPTTNNPPLTVGNIALKENVLENGIEATTYRATPGTTGFFVLGMSESEDIVYTLVSDIPEPELVWLVGVGLLAIELRRKLLHRLRHARRPFHG